MSYARHQVHQYNAHKKDRKWEPWDVPSHDPVTKLPYIGVGISSTGKQVMLLKEEGECVYVVYNEGNHAVVRIDGLQEYRMFSGLDDIDEVLEDLCKETSISEETKMSKYGSQSHDQIFEALVSEQYYTVVAKLGNRDASASKFRCVKGLILEEGDKVLVEQGSGVVLASVVKVEETISPQASAWVVQKVDMSAHTERQERWKVLYEGIKETEMAKKREVLAQGYENDLMKYSPAAATALAALTGTALPAPTPDAGTGD